MEQKQLDEIDDSYFGEEFIDDESFEDVVIEKTDVKPKMEKKSAKKTVLGKGIASQDIKHDLKETSSVHTDAHSVLFRKDNAVKNAEDKKDANNEDNKDNRESIPVKISKKESLVIKKEQQPKTKAVHLRAESSKADASKAAAAKNEAKNEEAKLEKAPVETVPSVNPWAEEKKECEGTNFLKEVSMWKAVTGLVVVLLIASIFTQGFRFSENKSGGAELSPNEAGSAALNYVNNNLLQPPFVAELESSEEAGDVYKVTLSVAGQTVDSYITKSGKLFFPQAFDTSVNLNDALYGATAAAVADAEKTTGETSVAQEAASTDSNAGLGKAEEEKEARNGAVVETAASEEAKAVSDSSDSTSPTEPAEKPAGKKREFTITAKKWLFSPQKIVVNAGDEVTLVLEPQGLDFTFSSSKLGIMKEVSGKTEVEFKAKNPGTYEFTCSSCEEWRGMSGIIAVE